MVPAKVSGLNLDCREGPLQFNFKLMSELKTGLLTDQNIVENICPQFLASRTKTETYEKDSLVYFRNVEVVDGAPKLIVSVGRLKNTGMSSATQSAMDIAKEFGLGADVSTKDYILLRQRLVLDASLADNPALIAEVGKPLQVNGVVWELTEEMNVSGEGEAYVTEDKTSRTKFNRLDAEGKVIYRKMHMAPVGSKKNVTIPFAGKKPVQGTTNIGALASIIASASANEAIVEE